MVVVAISSIAPAKNPHLEASYVSFLGKLDHRPPIFA
jgi:hypothetical protein